MAQQYAIELKGITKTFGSIVANKNVDLSVNKGEILDAEGKVVEKTNSTYVNGQILVIKGTEVSFYIPPTGIEVVACEDILNIHQAKK